MNNFRSFLRWPLFAEPVIADGESESGSFSMELTAMGMVYIPQGLSGVIAILHSSAENGVYNHVYERDDTDGTLSAVYIDPAQLTTDSESAWVPLPAFLAAGWHYKFKTFTDNTLANAQTQTGDQKLAVVAKS